MNIEDILKNYKVKKSYVETTLARIEQYRYLLAHSELWEIDIIDDNCYKSINFSGMPGVPRGSAAAPVEDCLIDKEINENKLKNWIKNDETRLFMPKMEIYQIEMALGSLTKQEKYIIELKYFDELFWKDIELNFNNEFRQKNYVSIERLKQINKVALRKLAGVLHPFYDHFKIA